MTIAFSEAIEQSSLPRSLLIGNGFSIAQAGGQFSYTNLLEKAGLQPGNPIKNVFTTLNTVDFELVMQALQHAAQIEDAYGDTKRGDLFRNDAADVREALINAVMAAKLQLFMSEETLTETTLFEIARKHQPVGWVEPLRNPSHVAIVTMGLASFNPSHKLGITNGKTRSH